MSLEKGFSRNIDYKHLSRLSYSHLHSILCDNAHGARYLVVMQHYAMKSTFLLSSVLLFMLLGCDKSNGRTDLGTAIISDNNYVYEDQNTYFPHDAFMASLMLDEPLKLTKSGDTLVISNDYNSGFSGHLIKIFLTPDLKIHKVKYEEFWDVIDGSETATIADKIILQLDKNPFKDTLVTGHYTLQIRNEYSAGELLDQEGVADTVYYSTFNGKFRNYSQEERDNGRDWILERNQIIMGIKDSSGIYHHVDEFAQFKLGNEKLNELLSKYKLERSETQLEKKVFVTVRLVIDELGNVDPNMIRVNDPMNSNKLLNFVRSNDQLLNNWQPAIYEGKPVKSEQNLMVRITE
ncbi:MAG: hypothetical protein ABJN36_08990 [Cyclobacteriaceae bacterium]